MNLPSLLLEEVSTLDDNWPLLTANDPLITDGQPFTFERGVEPIQMSPVSNPQPFCLSCTHPVTPMGESSLDNFRFDNLLIATAAVERQWRSLSRTPILPRIRDNGPSRVHQRAANTPQVPSTIGAAPQLELMSSQTNGIQFVYRQELGVDRNRPVIFPRPPNHPASFGMNRTVRPGRTNNQKSSTRQMPPKAPVRHQTTPHLPVRPIGRMVATQYHFSN